MNRHLALFTLLAAALFCPAIGRCDTEQDKAAVRDVVGTQQAAAWNKHDAKAYAALFTEDGDCVNVVGWWWKGRAEIERKLTDAYLFVFKESVLTIKDSDIDVKFLAPDIAVAHVRWTMTGARTPKGIPEPQQGIQTQILKKQSGKWLVAEFQNTNAVPEMPFPKGPPTVPVPSASAH
jgi:uncharacterized protein (TIGR02246 family)